jgi:ComF family protein
VPCWQSLAFLTGDGCARCSKPMSVPDQICAPCLLNFPDHDGVRAAVAYDDVARTIILKLKHGGKIGLATMIARAMLRLIPDDDALLMPVPLHRWRMWRRGYNQSALITNALGRLSQFPVAIDILKRSKATPMLRGLNGKERASVVRGAFHIDPRHHPRLAGQTILLVDDVYTSGATTNACARMLKKAGAARVIILCWARVLSDD